MRRTYLLECHAVIAAQGDAVRIKRTLSDGSRRLRYIREPCRLRLTRWSILLLNDNLPRNGGALILWSHVLLGLDPYRRRTHRLHGHGRVLVSYWVLCPRMLPGLRPRRCRPHRRHPAWLLINESLSVVVRILSWPGRARRVVSARCGGRCGS